MTIKQHIPRAVYLECAFRVGIWNGDTPPAEFSDPINFEKVEITTPVQETEKLISNLRGSKGEALDSQNKPTDPAALAVEFNTLTPNLINLAIGAEVTEQIQTTSAIADEVIETKLDTWVQAANKYWDDTVAPVLKDAVDTTIAATKYEFDPVTGMIKATHADAVGAGMKLSYTKADRTWEEFDAGKAKSEYVMLVGPAENQVTGQTGILTIYKANLAADGTFDPVAGGYLSGSLAGDLITPDGYNSAWKWEAVTA